MTTAQETAVGINWLDIPLLVERLLKFKEVFGSRLAELVD